VKKAGQAKDRWRHLGGFAVNVSLEMEVMAFVAEETHYRLERINTTTRIADDIGCDGDDAYELFEAFARRFDVDLSGIQWNSHFASEGIPALGCLFTLLHMIGIHIHSSSIEPKKSYYPVTISDMVEAAKAKKWVYRYPAKP
jgi:hypothetical protein